MKDPHLSNYLTDTQLLQLQNLLAIVNNQSINKRTGIRRINTTDGLKRYIELSKTNLSKSTISIVKYAYRHFAIYFGSETYLDEVMTKENILSFRNYLFGKVKSSVYWKHLRSCFNTLCELDYFEINYFCEVSAPKFQAPKILTISKDELEQIRRYAKPVITDMILFTWLNGIRVGELVNLAWSEIYLTKKIMSIGSSRFTTKSKKVRQIPLNRESCEILIKYFPKTVNNNKVNYVFSKSNGFKYSTDFISKSFKKYVRAAKVNDAYHFHCLRSSYATNLSEAGVPVPTIQKLLGHSDIGTTMRYCAVGFDSLIHAIQKLDDYTRDSEPKALKSNL
jgi:site-specific recombinase XerD